MKKETLTPAQAGKLGGQKTAETHGPEFYIEIGSKGGQTVLQHKGSKHFSKIGSKGAQARWGRKVVEA